MVTEIAHRHFLVTSMLNNQHATLASGQSMLQPALMASQAGKTSRDFELVLMKTIRAKYYGKPPVALQGMPRGEESLGEIPVMIFFVVGHQRAFSLEILLLLLSKVTYY